jgi:hypothetical protein
MNRQLSRLTLCVSLAVASTSGVAANNTLGTELYPAATLFLREKSYCIEKICLGARIAEVQPLGVLYWQHSQRPATGWKCSLGQNTAEALLLLSDGRRARLTFDKVWPEGGEEQYRLTTLRMSVSDRLSDLQIRYMVKDIAARWKLPEGKPGVSWMGKTPENLMTVMLAITSSSPFGNPVPFTEITANAMLHDQETWIMSLPQCRAGLPKL